MVYILMPVGGVGGFSIHRTEYLSLSFCTLCRCERRQVKRW